MMKHKDEEDRSSSFLSWSSSCSSSPPWGGGSAAPASPPPPSPRRIARQAQHHDDDDDDDDGRIDDEDCQRDDAAELMIALPLESDDGGTSTARQQQTAALLSDECAARNKSRKRRRRTSSRCWRVCWVLMVLAGLLLLAPGASDAFAVMRREHQNHHTTMGRIPPSVVDPLQLRRWWARRILRATTTTLRLANDQTMEKGDDDYATTENVPQGRLPVHVGFICDGNSRWAQQRHLPALAGHAAGADRLVEVLQCLRKDFPTVRVCTFYAFSTENWSRPSHEIHDIFRVMEATIRQFGPVLLREGVEFRALGDVTDNRIPASLQLLIENLQVQTKRNAAERLLEDRSHSSSTRGPPLLCVAINYGGRDDIVRAAQQLARQVATGTILESDITESMLSSHLSTSELPDPDLIIRTSGESRLSNFFLWDAAYTELCFCDELWPDFDASSLRRALRWYATRQRRYGSRSTDGGSSSSTTTTTTRSDDDVTKTGTHHPVAAAVGDRHNGTTSGAASASLPLGTRR